MYQRELPLRNFVSLTIFSLFPFLLFAQPYWQPTTPIPGLSNPSIVTNRTGTILVGCSNGVYTSNDSGNSWRHTAIESSYSCGVLLMSDDGIGFFKGSYGTNRTTDFGTSWTLFSDSFFVHSIVSVNDTTLLAVADSFGAFDDRINNIFRSTDQGNSWVLHQHGLTADQNAMSLAISPQGVLYAGLSPKGLARSTDQVNWVVIDTTIDDPRQIVADADGFVYIKADYVSALSRWSETSQSIRVLRIGEYPYPDYYTFSIAISDSGTIYTNNGGAIYRSVDHGWTWERCLDELSSCWNLTFQPDGNLYLYGGSSIFRWEQPLAVEAYNTEISSIASTSEGSVYATTQNSILTSNDRGQTWVSVNPPPSNSNGYLIQSMTNEHLVCTSGGNVYRSTNRGSDWSGIGGVDFNVNNCAIADDLVYSKYERFYRIRGASFQQQLANPNPTRSSNMNTYIAFTGMPDGSCFASYSGEDVYGNGTVQRGNGGIFRIGRNETVWQPIGLHNFSITDFKVLPNGNYIASGYYVSDSQTWSVYIFRSTDQGANWEVVNASNEHGWKLNVDPNGYLYDRNMNRSTDEGITWEDYSNGFDRNIIHEMTFDSMGYAYVGTGANGVYRSVTPFSGVRSSLSYTPTTFQMGQNYPNPFNSTTTIRFSLPVSSNVSANLFDCNGRFVFTIANGNYSTGTHSIALSGNSLSSGSYFVRLQTDRIGSQTQRITLLK